MTRFVILVGLFLLLFTGTGVHESFAAPPNNPVGISTQSFQQETLPQAQTECCEQDNIKSSQDTVQSSITHGVCSIPVALIGNSDNYVDRLLAEKMPMMTGAVFEGTLQFRLKRPPRIF